FRRVLFRSFALWGCQSPSTKHDDQRDSIAVPEKGYSQMGKVNTVQHQGMKIVGKKDTVSFDLAKPGCVKISLMVPKDSGNIRINQLLMPNGEMDGPFGKVFEDSLHRVGTYKIIIAESLMQENPYAGTYIVKIETEDGL